MAGAAASVRAYFRDDPEMLARLDQIRSHVTARVEPSPATRDAARALHAALDRLDEGLVGGELGGEEYQRAYLALVDQAAPDVILAAAKLNTTLAAALAGPHEPADA
jgi:hypothetical protein